MKREVKDDTVDTNDSMARKKKPKGGRFPILDPYLACFYIISYFI